MVDSTSNFYEEHVPKDDHMPTVKGMKTNKTLRKNHYNNKNRDHEDFWNSKSMQKEQSDAVNSIN